MSYVRYDLRKFIGRRGDLKKMKKRPNLGKGRVKFDQNEGRKGLASSYDA